MAQLLAVDCWKVLVLRVAVGQMLDYVQFQHVQAERETYYFSAMSPDMYV